MEWAESITPRLGWCGHECVLSWDVGKPARQLPRLRVTDECGACNCGFKGALRCSVQRPPAVCGYVAHDMWLVWAEKCCICDIHARFGTKVCFSLIFLILVSCWNSIWGVLGSNILLKVVSLFLTVLMWLLENWVLHYTSVGRCCSRGWQFRVLITLCSYCPCLLRPVAAGWVSAAGTWVLPVCKTLGQGPQGTLQGPSCRLEPLIGRDKTAAQVPAASRWGSECIS